MVTVQRVEKARDFRALLDNVFMAKVDGHLVGLSISDFATSDNLSTVEEAMRLAWQQGVADEATARGQADMLLASAINTAQSTADAAYTLAGTKITQTQGDALYKPIGYQPTWAQVDKTASSLADLTTRLFSSLQSKPTTIAGYGITDAYTKTQSDARYPILDTGLIPASYLPAYVDDVLEAANFAALPAIGETGKIYVTLDNNLTYRWTGSAYVEISASLALGETLATAYRGDRGKAAYDHSLLTNNPHSVTAAQVFGASIAQNAFYGGPSSGGAGAGSLRALVEADIPSLSGTYLPLSGGTLTGQGQMNWGTAYLRKNVTYDYLETNVVFACPYISLTSSRIDFAGNAVLNVGAGQFYISAVGGGIDLTASHIRIVNQTRFSHLGTTSNDSTQAAILIKPSGALLSNYQAIRVETLAGTPVFSVNGSGNVTAAGGTLTGDLAITKAGTAQIFMNSMRVMSATSNGFAIGTGASNGPDLVDFYTNNGQCHFGMLPGIAYVDNRFLIKHTGSTSNDITQDALRIQPLGALLANYRAIACYGASADTVPNFWVNGSGNIFVGNYTNTTTASPSFLSLGASYSNAAGLYPKLRLYDDGSTVFGIGVSGNQIDYIVNSGAAHVFYNGTTERARISPSGMILPGYIIASGGGRFSNIGVGNSAAATTPGSIVKKMEIFDTSGASLGFIPIYDAIA